MLSNKWSGKLCNLEGLPLGLLQGLSWIHVTCVQNILKPHRFEGKITRWQFALKACMIYSVEKLHIQSYNHVNIHNYVILILVLYLILYYTYTGIYFMLSVCVCVSQHVNFTARVSQFPRRAANGGWAKSMAWKYMFVCWNYHKGVTNALCTTQKSENWIELIWTYHFLDFSRCFLRWLCLSITTHYFGTNFWDFLRLRSVELSHTSRGWPVAGSAGRWWDEWLE